MTLQELRYFVAAADTGHFGRAARACRVSQPTLSAGIRRLEEGLGVELFERSSRRILLSDRGKALVDRARAVLEEARALEAAAGAARPPLAGDFRLGVIPTVGPYLMPRIIPGLRRAHPELRLLLHEGLTDTLLVDLRSGRLDAVVGALPFGGSDLEVRPLYRETFLLATAAGEKVPAAARGRRPRAEELDAERLLLLEEGHCLRHHTLDVCGWRPTRAREELGGASLETLRQLVAAGVGWTLLPALAANGPAGPGEGVRVRRLAAPEPERTIGLASRRRFPRTASVEALATSIRAALPPEVQRADASQAGEAGTPSTA